MRRAVKHSMINSFYLLPRAIYWLCDLVLRFVEAFRQTRQIIFSPGGIDMIKMFFQSLEAMIRAVTYLLILVIGLSAAGLGAFVIGLLAFRMGQFFYDVIGGHRWWTL